MRFVDAGIVIVRRAGKLRPNRWPGGTSNQRHAIDSSHRLPMNPDTFEPLPTSVSSDDGSSMGTSMSVKHAQRRIKHSPFCPFSLRLEWH